MDMDQKIPIAFSGKFSTLSRRLYLLDWFLCGGHKALNNMPLLSVIDCCHVVCSWFRTVLSCFGPALDSYLTKTLLTGDYRAG